MSWKNCTYLYYVFDYFKLLYKKNNSITQEKVCIKCLRFSVKVTFQSMKILCIFNTKLIFTFLWFEFDKYKNDLWRTLMYYIFNFFGEKKCCPRTPSKILFTSQSILLTQNLRHIHRRSQRHNKSQHSDEGRGSKTKYE